jgi:DNA-binding GntR family transcriptional regulator
MRQKTADAVAEHITSLLLDGTLRGGDRLDVEAIAAELGVSRAPVREALAQLERDGLVTQSFHRRPFVARFDAATVTQAFELYALLNGWASGQAAARQDPKLLDILVTTAERIAAVRTPSEMEEHTRTFRKAVNVSVAGPHLRALLRSFSGLIPAASRLAMPNILEEVRQDFLSEVDAHRAADSLRAASIAAAQGRRIGREAVAVLKARGVLADAEPPGAWVEELTADQLVAAMSDLA